MPNYVSDTFHKLGDFFGGSEKAFFNPDQILGNRGPVWVDTKVPHRLYNEISELHQVIDKKAAMFSNGKFKLVKRANPEIEVVDKELMDLLENPNVLQSQNEWLRNYSSQRDVYGNQFMYFNLPTSLLKYPVSMNNISPRYLTPVLTGRTFDQVDIDGVIRGYKYQRDEIQNAFETKDVMWTKNADLDDPVMGISPLVSLKFPLSNTKLAYQYYNVISGESGAIGLLSTDSKDGMGAIPMDADEQLKIERQFSSDYGVGDGKKSRIAITSSSTKWQPMTYETRKLELQVQIDKNKMVIIDQYQLDKNIFSSDDSTYENMKHGIISSYNNSIIPSADAFTQSLSDQLNIDEANKLILDYSHIQILREDKLVQAQTLKMQLDSVAQAVDKGIITAAQAKAIYKNSFGLEF